jgi:hypothetical protein
LHQCVLLFISLQCFHSLYPAGGTPMQAMGSPYTPGAAAAGYVGFSSPASNLAPALAAQTPGQLAASLRAQNKSFDDVVLELADMVGPVSACVLACLDSNFCTAAIHRQ